MFLFYNMGILVNPKDKPSTRAKGGCLEVGDGDWYGAGQEVAVQEAHRTRISSIVTIQRNLPG